MRSGWSIEAIDAYRRAVYFRPHYALFREHLAFVLLATGNPVAAEEQRAPRCSSTRSAYAHNLLGAALLERGNAGLAIGEFKLPCNANPIMPVRPTIGSRRAVAACGDRG